MSSGNLEKCQKMSKIEKKIVEKSPVQWLYHFCFQGKNWFSVYQKLQKLLFRHFQTCKKKWVLAT